MKYDIAKKKPLKKRNKTKNKKTKQEQQRKYLSKRNSEHYEWQNILDVACPLPPSHGLEITASSAEWQDPPSEGVSWLWT